MHESEKWSRATTDMAKEYAAFSPFIFQLIHVSCTNYLSLKNCPEIALIGSYRILVAVINLEQCLRVEPSTAGSLCMVS